MTTPEDAKEGPFYLSKEKLFEAKDKINGFLNSSGMDFAIAVAAMQLLIFEIQDKHGIKVQLVPEELIQKNEGMI